MINERLKELRVSAGMSQVQVAEMLDLTQTSIQRYESNLAEAPYRVMLWYADHFDVSLDWIYGRCDKPQGKLYNYEPETFWEVFLRFIGNYIILIQSAARILPLVFLTFLLAVQHMNLNKPEINETTEDTEKMTDCGSDFP